MLKNKKIFVVLIIALICMALASVMIVSYLNPQRTTFYVFKENYAAGTPIISDMLTPVKADKTIVLAGSRKNSNLYFITKDNFKENVKKGDVLRENVAAGEALMTHHVSGNGGNEVEVNMSPNMVAVTIPVNKITGVTRDIRTESHVNVYFSDNDTATTELKLENIRVLHVAKNENELEGVTLELDNEQASDIINCLNVGKVYLGIVNPDGYIYEAAQ